MRLPLLQAGRDWLWAALVPALPEIADDDTASAGEMLLAYNALAESIATSQPGSCAVQIRLISAGTTAGAHRGVSAYLLGRARTSELATDLYRLAVTTLPPELALAAAPLQTVAALVAAPADGDSVVEIRRRVEDVAVDAGYVRGSTAAQPAVLRWDTDPAGLRQAATLLAQQTAPTSIVLHMQPAVTSPDLISELDATIRDIVADHDVASSPLRTQVVVENRRRIRDLPRAAVRLRVLLVSPTPISASLSVTVGMALTGGGGFEAVKPRDDLDRFSLFSIVESLADNSIPATAVDELLGIADTYEAGRVVRFPAPASGGSVGLYSSPLPSLPRAAEPTVPDSTASVRLGPAFGGGEVVLTLRELNQHLVVCGLPGFGKTITTQTLLARLFRDHQIPFLVIDPAKSDYTRLAGELGDDVSFIDLEPEQLAFNPFGVPEGCPTPAHAGRVLAAFDAAFQLSSTFPAAYVTLARSIYRAYEVETTPTFASLTDHVKTIISETGYVGETLGNIRGALLGRLEFLTHGPLGLSLTAPATAGVDYAAMMAGPTVVSLRRFSGPTERALVFGLLLAGLISYREHNPIIGQLGHVTVLEEAHRLLSAAPGSGIEAEGVRLFVEAIAELRGSGEGFIVVDQAPTLLHPGVLKLAGSLCTHRLVDPVERVTIGAALLLSERQSLDLARLTERQIVLHSADRAASVVATVDAPEGLFAAVLTQSARSNRLPWRASKPPEASLVDLVEAAVAAGIANGVGPLPLICDVASQLHDEAPTTSQFRAGVELASDLIKAEIHRRTRSA